MCRRCSGKVVYYFTATAPALSLFSLSLHTIHGVFNTSVKASGGAQHYLPRKVSWELYLVWFGYVLLGYISFYLRFFSGLPYIYPIFAYNGDHRLKPSHMC